MSAIEVSDLTIRYGSKVAVDRLSFSSEEGTVLVVLGPNGAGKTSTIETLEGYRIPSSGRVSVLGLDPKVDHKKLAEIMGVMLQKGGVNPRFTPRTALRLFAGYYANPLSPDSLIDQLDLGSAQDTTYRRLSGGEAQRLSLALAIIGRPKVAFLDEPTAGVDPAGRLVIREMIQKLRLEGTSIVLTTHELAEAEKVADQVMIIANGKDVAKGSVAELYKNYSRHSVTFATEQDLDITWLASTISERVEEIAPRTYRIYKEATPDFLMKLTSELATSKVSYSSLNTQESSLESIYLELTVSPNISEQGSSKGHNAKGGSNA